MSTINSTGLYGSSYLFEDVETLKTLSTEHDTRIDILETDDTSSKSRLVVLEGDNTLNKNNISTLEDDNTTNKSNIASNTTRIDALEDDNTSNITRLDDLETQDTDNKLRLDDAEDQIFVVVHEPNKHVEEFFYFTPLPVPYDILEAYSQLIHSKSLTLKDRFDEYETLDIKDVVKVIQEIIQDHEMKIVALEFFGTLSEAKAAAQFIWAAGKVFANKFGKKIIKKAVS